MGIAETLKDLQTPVLQAWREFDLRTHQNFLLLFFDNVILMLLNYVTWSKGYLQVSQLILSEFNPFVPNTPSLYPLKTSKP